MGGYGGIAASIITTPIGRLVSYMLLFSVFSLMIGAINSWYSQTIPAGVINSERFERIVAKGTFETPDEAWSQVTAVVDTGGTAAAVVGASAYKVAASGTGCAITATTVADTVWYAPSGTQVTVADDAGTISGCEWQEASPVLQGSFQQLISIILQAIGLAGPILILTEVGTFGHSMLKRVSGNPIMQVVGVVLLLLLAGALLNSVIPFLSDAYQAIDANRFVMYDQGIGRLSTVISNFFGVALVASMLALGWGLFQTVKGGNAMGGYSQRM